MRTQSLHETPVFILVTYSINKSTLQSRLLRTSRQAKGSMPPNPASSLDRRGIDHRPPPRASSPKYRRLSAPQAPLAVKYSLRP